MAVIKFYDNLTSCLRSSGDYVWPLALRLILAWEFWEAGITKLHGENWFGDIPAWAVESIVPLAFALIGLRYLLRSINSASQYNRHRRVAARRPA